MHLSIKFESCSRLFFCSCYVVEYLPPRSAKFASPELMHYETYGSIKLALPIVHRRHMFSYPIWLLYLLSPVLVGALGWGVVIYLVAYYLWGGFSFWWGEWVSGVITRGEFEITPSHPTHLVWSPHPHLGWFQPRFRWVVLLVKASGIEIASVVLQYSFYFYILLLIYCTHRSFTVNTQGTKTN